MNDIFLQKAQELVVAGKRMHTQGWVPATSGNFSARVDASTLAITVSGHHKGELNTDAIMAVDYEGNGINTEKRSSAETLLHTQLYKHFPDVGAVLHTHSVNSTLLSRISTHDLILEDYELLKAFEGIDTHESRLTIPVFPNDQNIERLSQQVAVRLQQNEHLHGYLIAGHGLYAWGSTVLDTVRHLEAFEFLFQCELTLRGLSS
ncbi:MAG: methylthioribulose 1-phosphate dehydratase [Gammaproteobacteria bacterium]|nr:methylthioribulose 1-phosphate dehydratase [Gammaproteobacteria bacterium]MDH5801493.1 methylthioribulose 1-phosphate dehydratase [Gammaproteobacteria bacterium]